MKVVIVDDRPLQAISCAQLVAARRPDATLTIVATPGDVSRLLPDGRQGVICLARHKLPEIDAAALAALTGEHAGVVLFVFSEPADLLSCAALFAAPPRVSRLTEREAEVYALLQLGLSNKLIARRLGRSLPTVKTHLANIFRKLDAQSRLEAICKWQDTPARAIAA